MKRRRSDNSDEVNLDSLLDTMTNVVGILVLVLVVSQMGVQSAIDRIIDTRAADPSQLDMLRKQFKSLTIEKDRLTKEIHQITPATSLLKRQAVAIETNIHGKQLQLQQLQIKNSLITKQNQELQKKLAAIMEDELKYQKITKELNSTLELQAKLEAILDNAPPRAILPPKIVNIPDPRPAPDGIQPIFIFCINNQIYPVNNLNAIKDDSRRIVEFILKNETHKYIKDPKEGILTDVFLNDCNRTLAVKSKGLDYFEIKLSDENNIPHLVFEPRLGRGIPIDVVADHQSSFFNAIKRIDPQRYYLQFYVKVDSFDAYISMRHAVKPLALLAGWEPQNKSWVYKTQLGGSVRFGPPPPPPDPNAPKPRPRTPAAKPKVID